MEYSTGTLQSFRIPFLSARLHGATASANCVKNWPLSCFDGLTATVDVRRSSRSQWVLYPFCATVICNTPLSLTPLVNEHLFLLSPANGLTTWGKYGFPAYKWVVSKTSWMGLFYHGRSFYVGCLMSIYHTCTPKYVSKKVSNINFKSKLTLATTIFCFSLK